MVGTNPKSFFELNYFIPSLTNKKQFCKMIFQVFIYLYVVNRAPKEIEPSGGFVPAYEIANNGTLQFLNKQLSHGADPCHVAISPKGNYLLAANHRSGNITVFKINRETGIPEFTGKQIKIPAPVCIEFL